MRKANARNGEMSVADNTVDCRVCHFVSITNAKSIHSISAIYFIYLEIYAIFTYDHSHDDRSVHEMRSTLL